MAKALEDSAPGMHAQRITGEQFDAKANRPLFGSLLAVAIVIIALTITATVNPELATSISSKLITVANALIFLGIPYTGEFATGPLPKNVYVVTVAVAIWWALFAAVLYGVQFLVVYRPFSDPASFGRAIQTRNNCSLYHPKIWRIRIGLLTYWIGTTLFLVDAVTGFFPFQLKDGVVTVVWPLLAAGCGLTLLWVPIAEVALLSYDCQIFWRWAHSSKTGK